MRLFVLAQVLFFLPAFAERLPVKSFNTNDGLSHNRVNCIVQTADGFIWFCTDEGLSRFDGNTFVNYTRAHGLPHEHVNAMLRTRSGNLWLATDGGLVRFDPDKAVFQCFPLPGGEEAQRVNAIAENDDGSLWCATAGGLYRAEIRGTHPSFTHIALNLPPSVISARDQAHITSVFVDSRKRTWAGTVRHGGFWSGTDGSWHSFGMAEGLPENFVDTFWEDRHGIVWAGTRFGGAVALEAVAHHPWISVRERLKTPGLGPEVRSGIVASDGGLWIAGSGIARRPPGGGGPSAIQKYGPADGLTDFVVLRLAEDRNRNLWLGTHHAGVARIPLEGFRTYTKEDGFPLGDGQSFAEGPAGEVCLWSGAQQRRTLHCLTQQKFQEFPVQGSGADVEPGSNPLVDRSGWWWFPSKFGLRRFQAQSPAGLAQASPAPIAPGMSRIYTRRLFEDAAGNIWIGAFDRIVHWNRSTGGVREFHRNDIGGAELEISAFAQTAPDEIWIGQLYRHPLLRYRKGHVEVLPAIPNAESTNALHADRNGRLWIGTSGAGLIRVDNPSDERPAFGAITKADGLSSNEVYKIVSDRWNRLYVATAAGVDRLTADGQFVRTFNSSDGLVSGRIQDAMIDRSGELWVATSTGASRLTPLPDAAPAPPVVRISSFQVRDRSLPVSALGQASVGPFEFGPDDDQIRVGFLAVDHRPAARLRFQVALGEGDPVWSAPSEQRFVSFPRLEPGHYLLRVRAVNEAGLVSQSPARADFTIKAPFWRRWWFLLLAAAAVAGLAHYFHRLQMAKALALERMRARISADLHDDIGSSLSRVVLLSEVARSRIETAPAESARLLNDIAATGRELLDGVSDIVWAVDPRRDRPADLASRIRDYAGGATEGTNIQWQLEVTGDEAGFRLEPEHRRQIYLVYKEAIRNVVRHARATQLNLKLISTTTRLAGEISDNGTGIDTRSSQGYGLRNMRARMEAIGGKLSVQSEPGKGTTIVFHVLTGGRKAK